MKTLGTLGERYPVSGPEWRTVVTHCEHLTHQENATAKERHASQLQQALKRDQKRYRQSLSDEEAAMQQEIEQSGFGR